MLLFFYFWCFRDCTKTQYVLHKIYFIHKIYALAAKLFYKNYIQLVNNVKIVVLILKQNFYFIFVSVEPD